MDWLNQFHETIGVNSYFGLKFYKLKQVYEENYILQI